MRSFLETIGVWYAKKERFFNLISSNEKDTNRNWSYSIRFDSVWLYLNAEFGFLLEVFAERGYLFRQRLDVT